MAIRSLLLSLLQLLLFVFGPRPTHVGPHFSLFRLSAEFAPTQFVALRGFATTDEAADISASLGLSEPPYPNPRRNETWDIHPRHNPLIGISCDTHTTRSPLTDAS